MDFFENFFVGLNYSFLITLALVCFGSPFVLAFVKSGWWLLSLVVTIPLGCAATLELDD